MVGLLKNLFVGEEVFLVELIIYCVLVGVDDVVKVKVEFLVKVVKGEEVCFLIFKVKVIELFGIMFGGFNVKLLIDLLVDVFVGGVVVEGLKKILLVFDFFYDVVELVKVGNVNVKGVM